MQLYLIRHAWPLNPTDPDPPLSEKGLVQASMLAKLFATIRVEPASVRIIASHLQRARQTAVYISQEIVGTSDEVLIWPAENDWKLGNDLTTRFVNLLRKVAADDESKKIIAVGHFNYLNETLAWEVDQNAVSLPDAYGAIACLACKHGEASIQAAC